MNQPTFGWTRDKRKEGDFLGYGRKTVPSEVVDQNDTEFEIWQKVVRPDIVVHEWVQATNYCANQWLKAGGGITRREVLMATMSWKRGITLQRGNCMD